MDRRSLLFSTTAAAMVLAVPFPRTVVLATPNYPTKLVDNLEVIERVFDTLESYRFGLFSKTKQFGIPTAAINSLNDLRFAVHTFALDDENIDTWDRIEHLTTIRRGLDKHLGEHNISEHMRWLATIQHVPGRTCHDMMEDGRMSDLYHVAKRVREVAG